MPCSFLRSADRATDRPRNSQTQAGVYRIMSMNLALLIDGRIDRDEIDLYQTDTDTTRMAMKGNAYEVYASYVREIFNQELISMQESLELRRFRTAAVGAPSPPRRAADRLSICKIR